MISDNAITKQIADYRQKLDAVNQQLEALEKSYQLQKEQGTAAVNQLLGAIAALELLQTLPSELEPVASDAPVNSSVNDGTAPPVAVKAVE